MARNNILVEGTREALSGELKEVFAGIKGPKVQAMRDRIKEFSEMIRKDRVDGLSKENLVKIAGFRHEDELQTGE